MPESSHLEVLSNVDILANLEKKDLAALAAVAKVEKQKAGRIIFRQGEPAGSYLSMRRYAKFLIEKGLVNAKDVLEILPAAASATEVK
jgi:CRP-like cAMP-binding protein